MEPISATLITCNEQAHIEAAIQSVSWADEILVVDSGSTDATTEISRRFTRRVLHRDWTGFVDQKNFAVEQAAHDWIFALDADERVSPALAREIEALRRAGPRMAGYRIPRMAFFMGRWIRHGDWFPDYQLRLFDRRRGRWQGGQVHESVRVAGEPGFLKGSIHHYTYNDLSDYLGKLNQYSTLAAGDCLHKGIQSSALKLATHPLVAFVKAYLLKRGCLDGVPGLMVAVMGAISVYCKYAKLYELQKISKHPTGPHPA
jgi:glycosyltransferase involved in cell wall biosynthesis